uniref:Uncharacterized protein n=1 Tax=viral metagenome TaxID=1070528 RepID=A0A6M3KH82_9ZZZZ
MEQKIFTGEKCLLCEKRGLIGTLHLMKNPPKTASTWGKLWYQYYQCDQCGTNFAE